MAAVTRVCPDQPPPVPHVTLVGPAEIVAPDRESELVRALGAAARVLAPCTVRYDGLSFFRKKQCIWVRVVPTPELALFQKGLARVARRLLRPSYQSGFPYRPHITLAARLFEWEGAAILRSLEGRAFNGSFPCMAALLMKQVEPDAPWQRLSRLRLGGMPPPA